MATAILSALAALFGLISTALTSGVNTLKKENEALKKENADLKAQLQSAKETAATELNEAIARREKVISELKAEIERLEKDNEAQKDPAVVRARLSRLLNPL
jgi:DNA anti-recombination protein RmuC